MDKQKSGVHKWNANSKLKNARIQRGWTQQYLAERIGIEDPQTISRWERGASSPSLKHRQNLRDVFGLSMEELGFNSAFQSATRPPVYAPNGDLEGMPLYRLPHPDTSFIGRQKEIARVCLLLKRSGTQLITLLGTGGIGKTRLGIQVADSMREYFIDGICFVALDSIHDADLVIVTIARELGIHDYGKQPLIESMKYALSAKHMLLLLDSFEHLVGAAPLLAELLQACPQLKMLVTSRARLHLPGEQSFPVSPLQPEPEQLEKVEALLHCAPVELFVKRAQVVQPNFKVTVKNVQVILDLCKHLNYLPLAIELAASHTLLSPQALLARLPQAYGLLLNELQGAPERHQTLSSTVQWSYELLTPDEQWLFRNFAVFSGGIALNTIEDFFQEAEFSTMRIIHLTHSLLNKSLLQRESAESSNPRIFMLDTVREFGLQRLHDRGELELYQRSHALHYLSLIEKAASYLVGSGQERWLLLLDQERLNLQSALKWLLQSQEATLALRFVDAFGKFCGLRGAWSEEYRWLEMALALPCPPDARMIRARVLRRIGYLSYRFRNLEVARAFQEESIIVSRECMDWRNLAGALVGLGLVLYRQKEIEIACQVLRESVKVARETRDNWTIANALHSLARVILFQDQVDEAEALLSESRHLLRHLSDKDLTVRILSTCVSTEIARGDVAQATLYAQECLQCAQELGTAPLLALALNTMGNIACLQKDYTQAKQYLRESIAIACRMGDELTVTRGYVKLAQIALVEGDLHTIRIFVYKKLHQRYDIPEMTSILEACKQYIKAKKGYS